MTRGAHAHQRAEDAQRSGFETHWRISAMPELAAISGGFPWVRPWEPGVQTEPI